MISYPRFYIFIGVLGFGWGAVAAALFQAILNVLNMANPVILGLCNIIPQAAARAGRGRQAWRAACAQILLGIPPNFLYNAGVFAASEFVLHVFYGQMSPYLELSLPLRILAIAFAVSYGVEMICSFLHEIDALHLALIINAIGLIPALILVYPFTSMFGLVGSCATLVVANAARLIASLLIMARTTADEPHRLT